MASDEWGPWIEHDGKGCPCKGQYVSSVTWNGDYAEHIAGGLTVVHKTGDVTGFSVYATDLWDWGQCDVDGKWHSRIIRYRIRKPKGLTILQDILREVERADEMV